MNFGSRDDGFTQRLAMEYERGVRDDITVLELNNWKMEYPSIETVKTEKRNGFAGGGFQQLCFGLLDLLDIQV